MQLTQAIADAMETTCRYHRITMTPQIYADIADKLAPLPNGTAPAKIIGALTEALTPYLRSN